MVSFKSISVCALLLAADPSLASHTLIRRVSQLHRQAIRQSHSLAQDLRVAFGGILVPRADPSTTRHVVYCKPGKQTPLGPSPVTGGNNGTSTSTKSSGGGATGSTSRRPTSTKGSPGPSATPSSPWNLVNSHQGQSFFEGWDFFTLPDPTHGIVDFLDENAGRSNGLVSVNSAGNAIMRVETTPVVTGNRKSIRISTKTSFNGGLLILDSVHMPHGCGVWPAFWSNGPNWPAGGEIDILEGVGDYTNNQATIHTNVGCTLASSSANTLAISGNVIDGTDCAALTTGNQGCGIRASTANSYGANFNSNGGGVYAMKWDTTGIAIYFFPRGSIPDDITAEAPQPDSWGAAQARWPAASCDPFKFFSNHNAIFDTTLCGDWAGGVWNAAGIPGQEQSCAQRTGFTTCEAFVRAKGDSMLEAYWEVKSVKLYQLKN